MFTYSEHAIADDSAKARCFVTNKTSIFIRLAFPHRFSHFFPFSLRGQNSFDFTTKWSPSELEVGSQTSVHTTEQNSSLPLKCKLQCLWPTKHWDEFLNHVHVQMCFEKCELATTPSGRCLLKATVMSSELAVWSATCKSNRQREKPAQPWHSMQGN